MDNMACNKGQRMRKAKKKQVKVELNRLKQAEKKKRRLEKALANSAAIISELEKKKQKKKEEQQRLDEEGAAIAEAVGLHDEVGTTIAEAVALHVLLGEDSDNSCNGVINDSECKTWNYNHKLGLFMGERRAFFPHLDGGMWSVSAESSKWSFTSGPLEKNVYEPLYEEAGWGPTGFSVDFIAAQAVRSLHIAKDEDEARIIFQWNAE